MDQMLWLLVTLLLTGALSLSYLRRRWRRLPPGPTGFPIVGSLPSVGPAPHLSLHALSRTYGPIMHLRLGSVPTVVVSSAEAAENFVRGANDAAFANRPPSEVFACISYGLKGFAFAEHGPYWRHLRRLCVTHLLSAQKVSSFRSSRRQELQLFVKALGEAARAGRPVNVSAALAELVANMVCRMIMGRKFEAGDEDGERFQKLTKDLMGLIGAFNVNDFIPLLGIFDVQGMRRRMRKVHDEFDAMLEKILDEHLERKKKKKKNREKQDDDDEQEKDFVDVMLEFMDKDGDNQVEGVQFDRTTVKAIVLDMLEASMDTQRTPIEWALCELLRNPTIMQKVQQELKTVVGRNRQVEESDLPNLKYLSMVLKETLRLHPLSAFLFHYSKEECEVAGFRIPKGSNLMINLWALGRDAAVWDDVLEFKPERFVDTNADFRDFRLLSFGAGRRMCAGMQLALVICPLILAQMVHCFDWVLPEGLTASDLDTKEAYGFTMPRANPLVAIPIMKSSL